MTALLTFQTELETSAVILMCTLTFDNHVTLTFWPQGQCMPSTVCLSSLFSFIAWTHRHTKSLMPLPHRRGLVISKCYQRCRSTLRLDVMSWCAHAGCVVQCRWSLIKLVNELWVEVFNSSPVKVANTSAFAARMTCLQLHVVEPDVYTTTITHTHTSCARQSHWRSVLLARDGLECLSASKPLWYLLLYHCYT